ncbi:hypothetical protein ACPPVO_39400 [Dactylosporangium sp. McL0621]|uniref:hypothetical protein n=1 Tax=Dactylosporangium sp. McL0621 TaxID=3415678 RepID=UPI003CFB1620
MDELGALIERYAAGDEAERAALRERFKGDPAHLPVRWHTAGELRARLIHLCLRDQGDDTRDELLALHALCERAKALGIDPRPYVREAAPMAGDVDHYGMGSLKSLLARAAYT